MDGDGAGVGSVAGNVNSFTSSAKRGTGNVNSFTRSGIGSRKREQFYDGQAAALSYWVPDCSDEQLALQRGLCGLK